MHSISSQVLSFDPQTTSSRTNGNICSIEGSGRFHAFAGLMTGGSRGGLVSSGDITAYLLNLVSVE